MFKVGDKINVRFNSPLLEVKSIFPGGQHITIAPKKSKDGVQLSYYKVLIDGMEVMMDEEFLTALTQKPVEIKKEEKEEIKERKNGKK